MVRYRVWTLGFAIFAFVYCVEGQTSNATCISNTTTSWLFNSEGHSPCLVWSRLQSLCLPSSSFLNVPPLLDPSWSYNLPSGETACQCNVVSYALMAGCTWCQVGNNGNWAEESQWRNICRERYSPDGLGFAESVVVLPPYAWRPWDDGRWSPAEASASASLYISSTPTGTTTLSRSFPAVSTSSSLPTQTSSSPITVSPSSSSSSGGADASTDKSPAAKWGPIVGGIAGGIIALVLLYFLIRHLRRKDKPTNDPLSITKYKESDLQDKSRSRAGSFLNMFGGYPSPRGGRDRDMKRETELITDPMSFATPRPAPKAPAPESPYTHLAGGGQGAKGKGKLRKDNAKNNASADRLQVRNGADIDDDLEHDSDSTLVVPTQRFISRNNSDDSIPDSVPIPSHDGKYAIATPRTPGQDFSQPRPYSEIGTLPSLYEPPTGAPTFRGTMHSEYTDSVHPDRPETLLSPRSHYPTTERYSRESTIGAALGSASALGREEGEYWSKQALPPIPGDGNKNAQRRK